MYFIRHSERLDKTNPEVWKASTRYLENAMDTLDTALATSSKNRNIQIYLAKLDES